MCIRARQAYNRDVNAPTDETLLQEFLAGNTASFELLVRRHATELYQFVTRFARSAMAAEDIVQDTLVQVYTSAGTFDPKRRFKPWLFTIAANKARDFLRGRNRKREVPLDAHVGENDDSGQRFVDLMNGVDELPGADLEAEEKRRLVRQIVDQMPERLSEVLVLAYYHKFPYRDIADIIGVPLGTVKSRLHAAVAYFGERYQEAVRALEAGNQ